MCFSRDYYTLAPFTPWRVNRGAGILRWFCLWMKSNGVTIQMKPLQKYFHSILFIYFWVCGWNPLVLPFKWNLFSSTFTWYYLFIGSSTFWVRGWNCVLWSFKWNLFSSNFTFLFSFPYFNKLQFAYALCNFLIGLLAVAFVENLLAGVVDVLSIV